MSVTTNDLEGKTIKELVALVNDKSALAEQLAEDYDKTPRTITNHWINGYYSVPKALVTEVKADLIAFITNEKTEQQ